MSVKFLRVPLSYLVILYYLLLQRFQGTTYVYDSFFRPYVAKHETDIDRNLLELRTRAGDMAILYWQKTASYGQTRIFDILQYIASQSTPPRRAQVCGLKLIIFLSLHLALLYSTMMCVFHKFPLQLSALSLYFCKNSGAFWLKMR